MVIEPEFKQISGLFSEDLCGVEVEGKKFGYIDLKGDVKIEPHYDAVGTFSKGVASVVSDDRVLFVANTGAVVGKMNAPGIVKINFLSMPSGARVYAVPLSNWDTSTDKEYLLSSNAYLVPEGNTNVVAGLRKHVIYQVIFLLGTSRQEVSLDPAVQDRVKVTFP